MDVYPMTFKLRIRVWNPYLTTVKITKYSEVSAQNFVHVHVHIAHKIVIYTNLRTPHNYARTYALRIEMRNWNYNFGYFHE